MCKCPLAIGMNFNVNYKLDDALVTFYKYKKVWHHRARG